jgi:ABC-type amino acid transport substrate-binding protein
VNSALAALTNNGTLAALQHKWLGIYLKFPTIKP